MSVLPSMGPALVGLKLELGQGENVELWLIRHGETTWNRDGLISGWSDPPLSDLGRKQASKLREILEHEHFDGIWSSDLKRAVETAELASASPKQDPRIRELNFGDLEKQSWLTADDHWKMALLTFDGFQAPGGEHVDTFRERVLEFVSTLSGGKHVLFVHGGLIRLVLRELGEDQFVASTSIVKVDWSSRTLLSIQEGGAT